MRGRPIDVGSFRLRRLLGGPTVGGLARAERSLDRGSGLVGHPSAPDVSVAVEPPNGSGIGVSVGVAKLVRLLQDQGYREAAAYRPLLLEVMEAPFCTTPVETIAETLHPQGCPLIVAHPGSGMPEYAPVIRSLTHDSLLAMLESGLVDGLEVHHPRHPPELQATYAEVAARHGALVSAGSDSHDARNPPRPHPAAWCQELLTRVGITIA